MKENDLCSVFRTIEGVEVDETVMKHRRAVYSAKQHGSPELIEKEWWIVYRRSSEY